MRPKIVIVGYKEFSQLARDVIQAIHIPDWVEIEVTELPLQILSEQSENLRSLYNNEPATVVISGDKSSHLLREELNNLVLPVKVSGFDFLLLLNEIQSDEITVLNFYKNIEELTKISDKLNVKFNQITFNTYEESKRVLKKLRSEGVKEVIGGTWIANIAQSYGIKGFSYYTHLSFSQTIQNALNILSAYKNEMEKSILFKTIINRNNQGIMTTDKNFKITIVNPSVEKIFNKPKNKLIGKKLNEIIKDFHIHNKSLKTKPQKNLLYKYKQKNIIIDLIPVTIQNDVFGYMIVVNDIVNIQETERQIRRKVNKKQMTANYTFKDIIGTSETIKNTVNTAKKFSLTESTILIQGDSGTGKELFAQSIHHASQRKDFPFVAINCAALPEDLLNSELFGYEEGAFTGAKKGGKPGLFELAHNGTIFLDEISELPLHLQSRLLRVIQEKEVLRIGGDKIIPVDVRIIAATNENLLELVQEKKFRKDLYYRINVLQLFLPPLKDRIGDIPVLLKHFIANKIKVKNDVLHSIELQSLLYTYNWPGNIRELENIVERFLAYTSPYHTLSKKEFITNMEKALYPITKQTSHSSRGNLPKSIDDIELNIIEQTLKQCNDNKTKAAQQLGISRTTL